MVHPKVLDFSAPQCRVARLPQGLPIESARANALCSAGQSSTHFFHKESVMNLIAIQPLGRNREVHRFWIESQRLNQLGFPPGTPLDIQSQAGQLTLKPAILGENHVSSRVVPGGRRPIIDLANQSLLASLAEYSEVKILAA